MHNIEHINYIKAPATIVYQALSTQEGLSSIWTKKLTVKPEIGFVNEFDFDEEVLTKMKVMELKEGQRVVWECIESDQEWVGTNISFVLSEEKEGTTRVILRHNDWRVLTDFYRWCNYNWAMFLYRLKNYCESQEVKHIIQEKEKQPSVKTDENNGEKPAGESENIARPADKNDDKTKSVENKQRPEKEKKQRVVVGENEETRPDETTSKHNAPSENEPADETNETTAAAGSTEKKQRVVVGEQEKVPTNETQNSATKEQQNELNSQIKDTEKKSGSGGQVQEKAGDKEEGASSVIEKEKNTDEKEDNKSLGSNKEYSLKKPAETDQQARENDLAEGDDENDEESRK